MHEESPKNNIIFSFKGIIKSTKFIIQTSTIIVLNTMTMTMTMTMTRKSDWNFRNYGVV